MDAFLKNFFLIYAREKKKEERQDLREENFTVAQYAVQFVQLFRFALLMVTLKSHKGIKFLKGLCADIYDLVAMLRPNSYVEVLKYVQLAEDLILA